MDHVSDVADYGDAPEIWVSGISRVSRVSKGTVRISIYADREVAEGQIERRVVAQLLCGIENLVTIQAVFADVIARIETAIPLNSLGRRAPAATH